MADEERVCPNCGILVEENEARCFECGYALSEEVDEDDTPEEESEDET
jgi:hypothetical protein